MTMKTLPRITAIMFQRGTNKVKQLGITAAIFSSVIIFRFGPGISAMTMKTMFRITAILFQLGTIYGQATGHNHSISVWRYYISTRRTHSQATGHDHETLSRITAIPFQLGTNKVRQLAITTAILSSFIIFRLGPHTPRQLAMTMNCLLYTSPSPRDQRGSRMPSSA